MRLEAIMILSIAILVIACQAVAELKDMSDISAIPSAVIVSVITQIEPDVLMALPRKQTLKRTLNKKRQKEAKKRFECKPASSSNKCDI